MLIGKLSDYSTSSSYKLGLADDEIARMQGPTSAGTDNQAQQQQKPDDALQAVQVLKSNLLAQLQAVNLQEQRLQQRRPAAGEKSSQQGAPTNATMLSPGHHVTWAPSVLGPSSEDGVGKDIAAASAKQPQGGSPNNTLAGLGTSQQSEPDAAQYSKLASSLAALAEAQQQHAAAFTLSRAANQPPAQIGLNQVAALSMGGHGMDQQQLSLQDQLAGQGMDLVRLALESSQGNVGMPQHRQSAPDHRLILPSGIDHALEWACRSNPGAAGLGVDNSQGNLAAAQLQQLQQASLSSTPSTMFPATPSSLQFQQHHYSSNDLAGSAAGSSIVSPTLSMPAIAHYPMMQGNTMQNLAHLQPAARFSLAGTAGNPIVNMPSGNPAHATTPQSNIAALQQWLVERKMLNSLQQQQQQIQQPLGLVGGNNKAAALLSGMQVVQPVGQMQQTLQMPVQLQPGQAWAGNPSLQNIGLDQNASMLQQHMHAIPGAYLKASVSESGRHPLQSMGGMSGVTPMGQFRPQMMTPRATVMSAGGSCGGSKRSGASRRRKAKMYQALNAMVQAVVDEGVDQDVAEAAAAAAAATLKGGVPNLPGGSAACASVVQAVFQQRLQQQLLLKKLSASISQSQSNPSRRLGGGQSNPGIAEEQNSVDNLHMNFNLQLTPSTAAFTIDTQSQVLSSSAPTLNRIATGSIAGASNANEQSMLEALSGSNVADISSLAGDNTTGGGGWANLLDQLLRADLTETSFGNASVHRDGSGSDLDDNEANEQEDPEDLQLLRHLDLASKSNRRDSPSVKSSHKSDAGTSASAPSSNPNKPRKSETQGGMPSSATQQQQSQLQGGFQQGSSMRGFGMSGLDGGNSSGLLNTAASPQHSDHSLRSGPASAGGAWPHIPSINPGSHWSVASQLGPVEPANTNQLRFFSEAGIAAGASATPHVSPRPQLLDVSPMLMQAFHSSGGRSKAMRQLPMGPASGELQH